MSVLADGNISRKRVVVLGCGYIGGTVAREALARGMGVTALTRNPATAAALREAGAEVVVADLAEHGWHQQIAGGADYVLNAVSAAAATVEGYRRSYVEGMRSIAAWAQARGRVGTLVYTSSTSVYPQDGGARVDETASTDGVGERGAVLLEAERVLRESAGVAERWFVLRLAGIYGPGRSHLIEQVRSGEVAGMGEHRLNLAHRDDVAAAIWAAWVAPSSVGGEILNVADDRPTPKAEVVAWLAERLGVLQPRFTGQPAGGRRSVTPDREISNTKAKTLLGWRPVFPDFRSGCEKMLAVGAE